MAKKNPISILFPKRDELVYKSIPDISWHDLGMDAICEKLSPKANERALIASIMKAMCDDPYVADFRSGVFEDVLHFPQLRSRMMELLDHVQFLNDYGSFKRDHDIRAGLWELLHRLSELDDYIRTVEQLRDCLSQYDIRSDGLKSLKDYIEHIYEDSLFAELKADVAALKADTSRLKSVTVGINLNQSFEVESIGLISVNSKEFKSSGILSNFAGALANKEGIKEGNEWNGSMRYQPLSTASGDFAEGAERISGLYAAARVPLLSPLAAATLISAPEGDSSRYVTHYLDKEISGMLSLITRRLEQLLSKYVNLSIGSIVELIPEFMYYIRWAEYIESLSERGLRFCRAEAGASGDVRMQAKGLYNLKLAAIAELAPNELVPNDLDFSDEHCLYLLTGANRGGKTTITQAVGLLFVLAQGGIRVPAESFSYAPVDCIYTHYPADEDKTMDLGRLGEECRRFKDIYDALTENSLLLLNETFSTTSFEEGYYIARDAVRALLMRRVRTVYNTHMHKLAYEVDELNEGTQAKAASLLAAAEEGERSFKMRIAPPRGRSYAEDIARKYGVTYEQLMS